MNVLPFVPLDRCHKNEISFSFANESPPQGTSIQTDYLLSILFLSRETWVLVDCLHEFIGFSHFDRVSGVTHKK